MRRRYDLFRNSFAPLAAFAVKTLFRAFPRNPRANSFSIIAADHEHPPSLSGFCLVRAHPRDPWAKTLFRVIPRIPRANSLFSRPFAGKLLISRRFHPVVTFFFQLKREFLAALFDDLPACQNVYKIGHNIIKKSLIVRDENDPVF